MLVSALFSREKYRAEINKVEQYRKLMNTEAGYDSILYNDIGAYGELFDGAAINIPSRSIFIDKPKKVKVCYIPTTEIAQIKHSDTIEIDKAYTKPLGEFDDTRQCAITLGHIHELNVASKYRELGCFDLFNGMAIDNIVIHEDNMGRARLITATIGLSRVMRNGNVNITYTKGCKYIYNFGDNIDNSDTIFYDLIRAFEKPKTVMIKYTLTIGNALFSLFDHKLAEHVEFYYKDIPDDILKAIYESIAMNHNFLNRMGVNKIKFDYWGI